MTRRLLLLRNRLRTPRITDGARKRGARVFFFSPHGRTRARFIWTPLSIAVWERRVQRRRRA